MKDAICEQMTILMLVWIFILSPSPMRETVAEVRTSAVSLSSLDESILLTVFDALRVRAPDGLCGTLSLPWRTTT